MDQTSHELLNEILNKTENDIIIMSIVILVGLVIFFIPFYVYTIKNKKNIRKADAEDRQQLMDIISKNSEVMGKVLTTLDLNNTAMSNTLKRIDDNSTDVAIKLAKLLTSHATMNNNLNEIIKTNNSYTSHMNITKDKIDKISLIENDNKEIKHKLELHDTKLDGIDERTKNMMITIDVMNANVTQLISKPRKRKTDE